MPLTHLVRVTCGTCRTVVVMEADLSFVFGEIITKPRLVNAWLEDHDEYFCNGGCSAEAEQKRPVIVAGGYMAPIRGPISGP